MTLDRAKKLTYPNGLDLKHYPWIFAKCKLGATGSKPVQFQSKTAKNVRCDVMRDKCTAIFHKEHFSFDLVDLMELVDEETNKFVITIEVSISESLGSPCISFLLLVDPSLPVTGVGGADAGIPSQVRLQPPPRQG